MQQLPEQIEWRKSPKCTGSMSIPPDIIQKPNIRQQEMLHYNYHMNSGTIQSVNSIIYKHLKKIFCFTKRYTQDDATAIFWQQKSWQLKCTQENSSNTLLHCTDEYINKLTYDYAFTIIKHNMKKHHRSYARILDVDNSQCKRKITTKIFTPIWNWVSVNKLWADQMKINCWFQ